jgi:hypothetical protein
MARRDAWDVALGCLMEAFRLGVAKGVQFAFDEELRITLAARARSST